MNGHKPSHFAAIWPCDSIFENHETELVAINVMRILSRTGDRFRPLLWKEYKAERMKDDSQFSASEEKHIFVKVLPYCRSAKNAAFFSEKWNGIKV